MLNGSIYTPDYKVEINFDNPLWIKFFSDTKTIGKIRVEQARYTYIEVKPAYDMNNMTRLFTNNQKFMPNYQNLERDHLKNVRDIFIMIEVF